MMTARSRALLVALLALVAAATPRAARAASPQEDVHFIAEHIPEAAQDARWFALPWPIDPLEAGRWQSEFDLASARGDGSPARIGDSFVALGVAFVHRPSGLDLGSVLAFPAFETATHPGLDRAYLIQVGWHPRRHAPR